MEKIYEKKKPSTSKTLQSVSNDSIIPNKSSVKTDYSQTPKNDTADTEPIFRKLESLPNEIKEV